MQCPARSACDSVPSPHPADGDPELRERIGGMAVREDYRRLMAACGLKSVQEPRLLDVNEFARTAA